MRDAPFDVDRLRREAERCERLIAGTSDPAMIRALREWAEDYRRAADEMLFRAA